MIANQGTARAGQYIHLKYLAEADEWQIFDDSRVRDVSESDSIIQSVIGKCLGSWESSVLIYGSKMQGIESPD
jgi:ubiquitin C-terminal hydrolase